MEQFINGTLAFISAHPAWAAAIIGATAFGESFVFLSLLFPGTTILIAAGALAATGAIEPVSAIVAGIVGATLGDSISFWIGQRFGPVIPNYWPFRQHPEMLKRGTDFFERYGGLSVFVGRFFGPLRAVIPLTAGMAAMPIGRFYVANILSAAVWAPALVLSGMLLSRSLGGGGEIESKIFLVSLLVGAAITIVIWARRQFVGGRSDSRENSMSLQSPPTRFAIVGDHISHHRWFYTAVLLGIVGGMLTNMTTPGLSFFVAGDTFYLSYLVFMASVMAHVTPSDLRRRATVNDEGIVLIGLITIVAICFSVLSLFALVNGAEKPDAVRLVLSIASAPLAWSVLHTVAAFHYAHRYYRDSDPGPAQVDAGGLKFPETAEPGPSDFVYYSFVVGMTAQVSDVQVTTASMRRVTVLHGVVSFFLNTVLIALAVNVAVALAQSAH